MARTNFAKQNVKAATPKEDRPKGLAKRVGFGARENLSRDEFAQLLDVFIDTEGKPSPMARDAIACKLNRCPKQISVWFSNRRQNLRDAREKHHLDISTADEKIQYLWSKYRVPASEKRAISESSGTPDLSVLSDHTTNSTRDSSAEVSEFSVPEAATPFEDHIDIEPVTSATCLGMLLRAAKLADDEEQQRQQVCEALLSLGHRV